jgi:hypothetical protein
MNINASIIDQRLEGIQDEIRARADHELHIRDADRLKSLSFLYLCVKVMLDLDIDEAFDCLTEGGGDFGVDAMHMTEEIDGEFTVTLFQGKYKKALEGRSEFEATALEAMVNAVRHIFDPSSALEDINKRLKIKVEAARSMIRDGVFPRVRVIACNNGLKWNKSGEEVISRAQFGDRVTWQHVNHDVLIHILQRFKPIDEMLRFTGKAIVEDMNYSRICVGRMAVTEIAALMKKNGDRLLERNIRRYLGLHNNRVNEGIRNTLVSNSANFYFFNNGITFICNDFSYNGLQNSDYQVRVENLQIVNGGQTCMTILRTFEEWERTTQDMHSPFELVPLIDASVLVRIYKLPKDNENIVWQITHATNSQNPVDLKDLLSNDEKQRSLEMSLQHFGYTYRRKRADGPLKSTDITSGTAAEAVLAVWREAPHQAKFYTREHFGKLYSKIFTETLNAAQLIIAVLLYRIAENHRRRPEPNDSYCVPYASCFIAMRMGHHLLQDLKVSLAGLNHQTFSQAKALIDQNGEQYFLTATKDIERALDSFYVEPPSMQQLSATFRRGDLIERLQA